MRILIAEDEKDLNRIITARLKEEHYSVDSCMDGGEVLEYLQSAEYDAVVLDIMMPVEDGLSVLKKDSPQIHIEVARMCSFFVRYFATSWKERL